MATFYDIFIIAVCAVLLLTAALIIRSAFSRGGGETGGWELRGAWRRLRAVARVTISEALRMKIAVIFILLLVVTLPVLCLAARGDGTLRGQVQMFLGYSLGLTSFYLSLLTMFFSSRTLAHEIATQQIHMLATKPIPRWQIVLGKWLGIMTLNALLVAFAVLFTYGGTRWIVGRFERQLRDELVLRGGLTGEQADDCIDAIRQVRGPGGKGAASPIIPALASALGRSDEQVIDLLLRLPESTRMDIRRLDELRRQVLVARASVRPALPPLQAEIDEQYKLLKEQNRLPSGEEWPIERIRENLRAVVAARYTTVAPLDRRQWVMKGPVPREDDEFLLSVRFRIRTGGYTPEIALPDGRKLAENTFVPEWIVGDPAGPKAYSPPIRPEYVDRFLEFEVPTNVIEPDGTIRVTMINRDPRRVDAVVQLEDGLEVLYRVGSFEENLCTAGAAILIPLALLAALGLAMSTFCTFPVAVLVCLVVFGICQTSGLIAESLSMTAWQAPLWHTTRESLRKLATETMFEIVSLGDISPSERVLDGRAIRLADLARESVNVVLLRAGLLLLAGVMVFRRRELAAVIV